MKNQEKIWTIIEIEEWARKKVMSEMGDKGTCVIGEKFFYYGRVIAQGIVQGCLTNEAYFELMRMELIKIGYRPEGFSIDYGVMD